MEHIKKQLNINVNKKGLVKIVEAARVCYLFENLKKDIIKKFDCRAISFKGGVLKIEAQNNPEASELRFLSQNIKKELNKKLKDEIVLKIIVITKF